MLHDYQIRLYENVETNITYSFCICAEGHDVFVYIFLQCKNVDCVYSGQNNYTDNFLPMLFKVTPNLRGCLPEKNRTRAVF